MMDNLLNRVREIISEADSYLSERDSVREKALRLEREVVRRAGRSVTLILSGRMTEAEGELEESKRLVDELLGLLEPYPDLLYSGSTYNALSEHVEAEVFHSIVLGRGVPGPRELKVPIPPYLQGLGDVVGELRRLCLDKLRQDRFDEAWTLLDYMEAIYMGLRELDYPDALAPGLRHKADVARRLVDDTKALLLSVSRQRELAKKISEVFGEKR
jgi:translin